MQNALVKGMGATDPCTQPGAWVVMKQGDKYYNVCIFTGEKFEVDAESAVAAGVTPGDISALGREIIPGVNNWVLLLGAVGAALVLPMLFRSRY